MITITNNGYIHFKNKCIGNGVVLSMLGEKVSLENGFTLNSFFKMMNLYPKLIDLEAYLPLYIDYYNSSGFGGKEFEVDKTQKIMFNTYIVENEGISFDKKHNLIIKYLSGYISNISNYHLPELLNKEIHINEKVIHFKVEENITEKGIAKVFVQQPNVNVATYPSDLYNFIMYICGNLFRGQPPDKRRHKVEMSDLSIQTLATEVLDEISKIVSSNKT